MSNMNELREKIAELTQEHLREVAGGECTVQQIADASAKIIETYENLVEATSYIIERVVGP
jgi:hypothetical protein